MKKSVKFLTTGLMLSSSLLATAGTVMAADGGVYDSNSQVTFEAGDNTGINPVDPTNPVVPIDPTDPHQPGTGGALSIDFASNLNFGTQKITSTDQVYHANAQEYSDLDGTNTRKGPNFVQVTDSRGTLAGWHLTVTEDAQLATAEGENLDGAQIQLTNGHVVTATDVAANMPTGETSSTLVPGAASDLMDAKTGAGQGTFLLAWGKDGTDGATSVNLNVPGKSIKLAKQYKANLTWTLTNAPK